MEIDLGDPGERCFNGPDESKSKLVAVAGAPDVADIECGCCVGSDGAG
jgi:hypothetical protein